MISFLIGMFLTCPVLFKVWWVFITRGLFQCVPVLPPSIPGDVWRMDLFVDRLIKAHPDLLFLFGACAAVCETRPGPRWALSTCNEQLWVLTRQVWPCSGSTTALRRDPRLWVTCFLFSLAPAVHISSSFQGESITEGAHKLFNMN